MRIVLFTISHERNYGAALQTHATWRTLHEMGHEVVLADVRLGERQPLFSRSTVATAIEAVSPQGRMSARFWSHIPSTRQYSTLQQLYDDPPQADLYLIGSDQVWNPCITGRMAEAFFLPFGNGVEKAVYAASMGGKAWCGDEALTRLAARQLRTFKGVSCREHQAVGEVRRIAGVEAVVVADPTLLRRDFSELTGEVTPNESVVCFSLYNDPRLDRTAQQMAGQMGSTFLPATTCQLVLGRIPWRCTPVDEWLRRMAGARFVVTHSYHGTVLSLLYHCPFAVVYTSSNGRQGRITELLDYLGLSNRFFTDGDEALRARIWEEPIDFEEVDNRIEALRGRSMQFLNDILR